MHGQVNIFEFAPCKEATDGTEDFAITAGIARQFEYRVKHPN